jgi:hypothetical protein
MPPAPNRAPRACGALGPYDRDRVLRIASRLGCLPQPVHEDRGSILLLDREPIRWGGGDQRGIGWIEGEAWRPGGGPNDWRNAAVRGLTGLVLEGRKRYLHTSLNGLAPIYWIEEGGAIYFASRIDPLVRTSPGPLSIDWEAWAATISLRYPLGERTPFAQVRRLLELTTLRRRFGRRSRPQAHSSPWQDIEPRASLATAADRVVVALEAGFASVDGGVFCPLSGGRDSRILFLAIAREGKVAGAFTTSDDEGDTHEEDLAAPVAAAMGVPHERLEAAAADYRADWEERARRVEYQFADHAWLVPVSRRLEAAPVPVPDGFGLDVFSGPGGRFFTEDTLDTDSGERARRVLFDNLGRYGVGDRALVAEFHSPIESSAREQFLAATRRFEGHPSQAILSHYATRSLRGVSTYPSGLLGDGATVLAPGAGNGVVSAMLEADPRDKLAGSIYDAIFERLGLSAGMLPSTAVAPRRAVHLQRRWRSGPALEMHRRSLADGPLAPHIAPDLRGWLDAPAGVELAGDLRIGMEAVSMLHAWWRRYRDVLDEVNPKDLLG